jgi:hypothetical protein
MWDPKKILVHTEAGRCFVFKGASLSAYKLVKRPQTMSDVTPEEIYRTLCTDGWLLKQEEDVAKIDRVYAEQAAAKWARLFRAVYLILILLFFFFRSLN